MERVAQGSSVGSGTGHSALDATKSMEAGLQALRFAELRVRCRAVDGWSAPVDADNILRSAFGRALKNAAEMCGDGGYAYLFETASLDGARGERAPHPFILRFRRRPSRVRPGASIELDLLLVGRAIGYADTVASALIHTGIDGLGSARFRFKVNEILEYSPVGARARLVYDGGVRVARPTLRAWAGPWHCAPVTELSLQTISPLHLVYRGKMDQQLRFATLTRRLLRRLSTLAQAHCGDDLILDYGEVIDEAERVQIAASSLHPVRRSRYSRRQDRRMPLAGVAGEVRYAANDLRQFLPLLELGALLQVGKGTAFGLGRYRIEVADPLGSPAPIKVKS